MFSRNKKTKLSGQDRFQNRAFTQKLNQARNFKRHARYIPEHPVDLLLSRFGFGTRLMQIFGGLVVLGILYLVYMPNFLTIKDIEVRGLTDTNRTIAQAAAQQAIKDSPFFNPQYNLVFLNTERIKAAVAKVPSVFLVNAVKKDFKTNTLIIEVYPKVPRFLVADTERVFDVYNDGSLKAVAGISKDDWGREVNPGMIKVLLPNKVNPEENKPFLTEPVVTALERISAGLRDVPDSPVAFMMAGSVKTTEVLNEDGSTTVTTGDLEFPIKSEEVRAVMKKGGTDQTFSVLFDTQSDLDEAIKKLALLLAQTSPDRYHNLNYIDMRLPERGYVCLNNTPCAK